MNIRTTSFLRLYQRKIYILLENFAFLSRWIIYTIDLCVAFIITLFILSFITWMTNWKAGFFFEFITVTTAVYAVAQLIFHPHIAVVRFSGINDIYRIIRMNIAATVAIIIIFTLIDTFHFHQQLLIIFSLVAGIFICLGQITYRILVRLMFETTQHRRGGNTKRNALIIGCDAEAASIAAINSADKKSIYKPVAFIDINKSGDRKKSIHNLPILGIKNIDRTIKTKNIKAILIGNTYIEQIPKKLFDNLIREDVELIKVNMSEDLKNTGKSIIDVNKIKIEDLLGRNAIEIDKESLGSVISNKVVLITGAAGSIGSEISRQVMTLKCRKLLILDQAETPLNDLWLELMGAYPNSETEIVPVVTSVTNFHKMQNIFTLHHPNIVFHAAAYKHVPMMELHPCTAIATNIGGTKITADLCIKFNVERFVMISTDKAVNPTNVMGATKRAAEIYVQSLFFNEIKKNNPAPCQIITTRFGNVLGSNGSVVPLFKKQIERGGPVTITHRDIIRYFMSIPEACSLVLEAGCIGSGGLIYIFDMGDAVKIYDLARKMITLSGKIPDKDIKIIETGLRPGEKLYEELLLNYEITLPTYNKKIMIAQVSMYDYDVMAPKIDDLLDISVKYNDIEGSVKRLKEIVPEFKSQNSIYSKLD